VRPRGADIPNRELKTKLIVQLCECYASEMADHLTAGEVLDFDGEISPTGHAKMKAAAEVCEPTSIVRQSVIQEHKSRPVGDRPGPGF
jgi:hypothetical protein